MDALNILDRIDQYVYIKGKDGVYRYVNEPFARIAGFSSKEVIVGKTDRDLRWKIDINRWTLTDKQILAGESIVRAEEIYRCGPVDFKILITKTPYKAHDGEIIGILGSFIDCTDRLILNTCGKFDEEKRRLHLEFLPDWLSAAEVRVCFYLIHGLPAPRIAKEIGTSVSTIRFHIENIKDKMQCENKSEIVEVAIRSGIAWKIFYLQSYFGFGFPNGENFKIEEQSKSVC